MTSYAVHQHWKVYEMTAFADQELLTFLIVAPNEEVAVDRVTAHLASLPLQSFHLLPAIKWERKTVILVPHV